MSQIEIEAEEEKKQRELEESRIKEESWERAAEIEEKNKKIAKITILVVAVCLVLGLSRIIYSFIIKPEIAYREGIEFLAQGEYNEATEIFQSITSYRDSATKLFEIESIQRELQLSKYIEEENYGAVVLLCHSMPNYTNYNELVEKYVPLWREKEATTYSEYDNKKNITLHSNGMLSWTGYYTVPTENWSDIVSVAAGFGHTVGLFSDGTLVATGENYYGESSVSSYKDVISIKATLWNTIGLLSDGTVFVQGLSSDTYGNAIGELETIVSITELENIVSITYDIENRKLTTISLYGQINEFFL